MSQTEREVREAATRKFNKNQTPIDIPDSNVLNSNDNYILDFNNLTKLRLIDGTIIDLSSPKY